MRSIIYKVLPEKLHKESCYFSKRDIFVKCVPTTRKEQTTIGFETVYNKKYIISIKDYNHIKFEVFAGKDSNFGYVAYVREVWFNDYDNIEFKEFSYNSKSIESVLSNLMVKLGYHIANTF